VINAPSAAGHAWRCWRDLFFGMLFPIFQLEPSRLAKDL
jgi:hypothetical protein